MFVLKGVLRAESQEKVLLYLLQRRSGYAREIAEFYDIPPNPVQKQLARLEADGVVASRTIGKARVYELNPRYPFMQPLVALLNSALLAYPEALRNRLLVTRERPRQSGKGLNLSKTREVDSSGGPEGNK